MEGGIPRLSLRYMVQFYVTVEMCSVRAQVRYEAWAKLCSGASLTCPTPDNDTAARFLSFLTAKRLQHQTFKPTESCHFTSTSTTRKGLPIIEKKKKEVDAVFPLNPSRAHKATSSHSQHLPTQRNDNSLSSLTHKKSPRASTRQTESRNG